MAIAQQEIEQANGALQKAVRERRAAKSDSPMVAALEAAIVAARNALTDAEVKLRRLYESKDDSH
jgi:hypothetical protein